MLGTRVVVFVLLALLMDSAAHAQGGIRAIFFNNEPVATGFSEDFLHYGLGYDTDLNDRLSILMQVRTSPGSSSWVVDYHSKYHFSDNDYSSFYLGPNIGVRAIGGSESATLVPVGMRMGVRGGLEGFYADLYVGGLYNIGGGGSIELESVGNRDLRNLSFCAGLDLGVGWGKKKKW